MSSSGSQFISSIREYCSPSTHFQYHFSPMGLSFFGFLFLYTEFAFNPVLIHAFLSDGIQTPLAKL